MKKLLRKQSNKMICGVCSGVADYFNLDVSLVRIGWVIFSCFAGSGLVAYIIAAVIVPSDDQYIGNNYRNYYYNPNNNQNNNPNGGYNPENNPNNYNDNNNDPTNNNR